MNNTALSAVADVVRSQMEAVWRSSAYSESLSGVQSDALDAIMKLASNCSSPDWDGYGALAINGKTVENTTAFIKALQGEFPMPDFSPEPDGSISLDWISGRYSLFSVSIGTSNRLAYAWLNGTDKGHAVAKFDGFSIPCMIKSGIEAILGVTHNGVRVA